MTFFTSIVPYRLIIIIERTNKQTGESKWMYLVDMYSYTDTCVYHNSVWSSARFCRECSRSVTQNGPPGGSARETKRQRKKRLRLFISSPSVRPSRPWQNRLESYLMPDSPSWRNSCCMGEGWLMMEGQIIRNIKTSFHYFCLCDRGRKSSFIISYVFRFSYCSPFKMQDSFFPSNRETCSK